MHDCKTCKHGQVLFEKDREDRFTTTYSPTGFVRCSGPRYKGRRFFIRERQNCPEYEKRSRREAENKE